MKQRILSPLLFALLAAVPALLLSACALPAAITVAIPGLEPGSALPVELTPSGGNSSPALEWAGAPAATQSFVVAVNDPDAAKFLHWAIYNIPATYTGLPAGIAGTTEVFDGMLQTRNAAGSTGWFGPAPPHGSEHSYVFTVFACDTIFDLGNSSTNYFSLEAALEGHVLAKGSVTYTFSR